MKKMKRILSYRCEISQSELTKKMIETAKCSSVPRLVLRSIFYAVYL